MRTYQQINPLQMAVRGEMVFDLTSEGLVLDGKGVPDGLEGMMISELNKDVQEIREEKNQEETEKNEAILWGNRHWEAYPFPQKAWLPYARLGKKLRYPEEKLKRSDQTDDKIRQQLAISDTLIGMVWTTAFQRSENKRNDWLTFKYTSLKKHFIKNLIEKNFFQFFDKQHFYKSTKKSEVGPALKTDSETLEQLEDGLKWLQSKKESNFWGIDLYLKYIKNHNEIDDCGSIEEW
jgi:hypothetical protein